MSGADSIPRESSEFVWGTASRNGVPTSTGVKVAVLKQGTRPSPSSVWKTPDAVAGTDVAARVSGLEPGFYKLWLQVTSGSEVVVLEALSADGEEFFRIG